jgi:hypothetical protein
MAEWTNLLNEAKTAANEQFEAAWKLHVDRVSEVLESGWRENIARIVEQRFSSLNEELARANEEWLAKELEERVAARLNEEWESQISQQVENRLGAEFDERVAARVEEVLPERIEHAVEQAVAEQLEQRLEAAVSDRVVALLPERVEEVLALRLAEELPGRLESERSQLNADWESKLAAEVAAAAASAAADARRTSRLELGRQLSESLRVLRVAADAAEWKNAVLEAASHYAGLAALFLVTEDRFTLEGVRGISGELETNFSLEYGEATAFQNALESKDVVVTVRTDSEVSPYVMSLKPVVLESSEGEEAAAAIPGKSYIFPVMVEDKVAALLYLEPKTGEAGEEPLEMGAIETVVTGAGLSLAAIRAARAVAASSLVNIASVLNPEGSVFAADGSLGQLVYEPVGVGADAMAAQASGVVLPEKSFSWDDLTQEERENHMRAQRFARTQVAEMRLYKDDAVKGGRRDGNIYLRLKEEIDAARERYQSQFLDGQTHMRDYLHAELVETLAIDNPQLMGPDYPGPLV